MVAIARKPQPKLASAASWLQQVVAIDVRGLAFLRIGFAAILLWDLAVRATAKAHHRRRPVAACADGAWPGTPEPGGESAHERRGVAAYFVVATVAAAFTVGCHAVDDGGELAVVCRCMGGITVVQGDVLLRCLLSGRFLCRWGPVGRRAWRAARDGTPRGVPYRDLAGHRRNHCATRLHVSLHGAAQDSTELAK
jgi:hypothetical protein